MESISRRSFMKTSLIAGAGLTEVPSMAVPLFVPVDGLREKTLLQTESTSVLSEPAVSQEATTCFTCLLQHIAMKLGRRLYWDPILERFKNDEEANAMLVRPERFPYQIERSLSK